MSFTSPLRVHTLAVRKWMALAVNITRMKDTHTATSGILVAVNVQKFYLAHRLRMDPLFIDHVRSFQLRPPWIELWSNLLLPTDLRSSTYCKSFTACQREYIAATLCL